MEASATPTPVVAQETPVEADQSASETPETADTVDEATASEGEPWRAAKHKVKVDGEELEVSYDDLIKSYQFDRSLTKKSQQTAEERKQVAAERDALAQFLAQAKASPQMVFELAKELGHDPDKLAEDYLWEKIQYQKLSEPERKAIEAERAKAQVEAELKELREKLEAQELQKVSQKYHEEIQDDIIESLKLIGKKPNPFLVARAAEIYQNGFKATGQKLGRDVVAKKLSQWLDQEFDGLTSEEPEAILGRLSPTTLKRLKDHFVKEAMATKQAKMSATFKSPPSTASENKKKMGIDDYFARFGK